MTTKRAALMALTLVIGFTVLAPHASAQEPPAPQVVVTSATADPGGQTLTITGANFGRRPLVTLDLVPLTVQFAIDSQIVAAAPVNMMPAGKYLLTVSRGPSAAENGSFQLTLALRQAQGERRGEGPKRDEPVASGAEPLPLGLAGTNPAAKVGDRVITVAEIDREWQRADPGGYIAVNRELYGHRRRVADLMVANELLAREAAARSLTTDALLEEEIPKRIVTMPESAVASLYQSLGARTRGATLDEMRPALRAWLQRITEPELAKMNYVEELMKVSTRADVLLAPPRVQVDRAAQDVVLGSADAQVEIVAFGDFQSAEYARFARVFGRVRETFGERVRLVFKHLPVVGPESIVAAQAAACANAQGRFWAYHDAVVAQPGSLGPTRLKQLASEIGLDRRAFEECLDGGQFSDVIQQAVDEAGAYAVRSSPSFLVNGSLAPPPPPFLPPLEFFTRIIEEELLRLSRAAGIAPKK